MRHLASCFSMVKTGLSQAVKMNEFQSWKNFVERLCFILGSSLGTNRKCMSSGGDICGNWSYWLFMPWFDFEGTAAEVIFYWWLYDATSPSPVNKIKFTSKTSDKRDFLCSSLFSQMMRVLFERQMFYLICYIWRKSQHLFVTKMRDWIISLYDSTSLTSWVGKNMYKSEWHTLVLHR